VSMAFIRVKEIGKRDGKKYRYAYLVENTWRKRLKGGRKGSRQKVGKYLGRVETLPEADIVFTEEFITETKEQKKEEVLDALLIHELTNRGFSLEKKRLVKDGLIFDIRTKKFVSIQGKEKNIVLEMNEGFFCSHTLRQVLNFRGKNDEDERDMGIRLANMFLESGLRVPKEVFVSYFEKV